ncbi:MAG: N-6 DNA methylase [Elusimicrobia bacterium GWC2_51_8]|nr:MAG: N-6 DNA methylase [Elusimicrobia bacterium GWC2_51_8]
MNADFISKTKELIDGLKSTCANYGLGNDGNEFKIITQAFLYKFLNDKFGYEVKKADKILANAEKWEVALSKYNKNDYEMLLMKVSSARLKKEHLLHNLFNRQNEADFAKLFDNTLREIATYNSDIFSVKTEGGAKVQLFDDLSQFISDQSKRDDFCRALINKLVSSSFEAVFDQKYDFFATIFEYLIQDYNKDGGGKYAEYYTPHAVSRIMASILVDGPVKNVKCYDPAAGSGTLLMSLAHAIGEDRCSIYSQDISQKSSGMLRLNLILNNLDHSIQNIVQGNTLGHPYHKDKDGNLQKFDYIVSNPPFKLDFSYFRNNLDTKSNSDRFFAGIPKIPNKKETMAIYLLFIQHIMHTLSTKGKAAVVVPTGFLTAQNGIEFAIRKRLVDDKMLKGVVSMPSNIFASTTTNVSVLFIDRTNSDGVILVNASHLGTEVKNGKNRKTVLSTDEENKIISTFHKKLTTDNFSIAATYDQIKEKNYSFAAGQYFPIKIEHIDITPAQFKNQLAEHTKKLQQYTEQSRLSGEEIISQLKKLAI